MADEIIQARVWQKVDTEENWLANPLILGTGEQGFVWELGTPNNKTVNFKIGDGTKTFAELPYFIAYYSDVVSHKIIRLPNVSTSQAVLSTFNQNTNLYDIVISNIGGDDTILNLGTTPGGNEIGTYPIGQGNTVLDLKYQFDSSSELYLSGFDGVELSIIIIYFDYSESPAIPPSSGGTSFRFPKNYVGMFMPVATGQLEACFDMITGMGIVGTAYENCQICNYLNPVLNMEDSYPMGYKSGLTPGQATGNSNNTISITKSNIPKYDLTFPIYGQVGKISISIAGGLLRLLNSVGGNTDRKNPGDPNTGQFDGYGAQSSIDSGGSNVPIDIKPKSKVLIYFLAIND